MQIVYLLTGRNYLPSLSYSVQCTYSQYRQLLRQKHSAPGAMNPLCNKEMPSVHMTFGAAGNGLLDISPHYIPKIPITPSE